MYMFQNPAGATILASMLLCYVYHVLALQRGGGIHFSVEGLYCERPIQCLASSEILVPHPAPPASVYPPALWGVNSSEDARHCFVLYICK